MSIWGNNVHNNRTYRDNLTIKKHLVGLLWVVMYYKLVMVKLMGIINCPQMFCRKKWNNCIYSGL